MPTRPKRTPARQITPVQTGFILAEEAALKEKVSGLSVQNWDNPALPPTPVGVWFWLPEQEMRDREFPYITITFIAITEATEREHRGSRRILDHVPDGDPRYDIDPDDPRKVTLTGEWPLKYWLDFQVTTHTRYARQDRALLGMLLQSDRLPHRFGSLDVPADNTVRQMDTVSVVPTAALDENKKRLFRQNFTVRVEAELLPVVVRVVERVRKVVLTTYGLYPEEMIPRETTTYPKGV